MIRSKPRVERDLRSTIVALKVAMVELVEIVARCHMNITGEFHFFESDVALRWCKCSVLRVHQHMDRVRRHDPVKEDATEVNDVLDRVHGKA